MHQFFPLTMEGMVEEAVEEGPPTYYGDDHLWIILAVTAYLRETGDFSLSVKSVVVDGEAIGGSVVPIFEDGGEHTVEVVLG